MREYIVSSSRLFIAVVLFGLAIGSVLVVGFRVFPAGASHTGDGTVHVCVNNTTGAMREVSRPSQCRSYERSLEFGGANGVAAPVSGYEVMTGSVDIPSGASFNTFAYCSPGKHVIGGGIEFEISSSNQAAIISAPAFNNTAWHGRYSNNSGFGDTLTVYAICAYTDFVPED